MKIRQGQAGTNQKDELRETVEERFASFQAVDRITIPHQWEIRYRKEPVAKPAEFRWSIMVTSVVHNTIGQ